MRRADSSSERLRSPHYRNPGIRRFLRHRRRDDRDLDADGGSQVRVLPPEDPSLMLLQNALTSAQSQAGESFGGIEIGRDVSESLVSGGGEGRVRDVDHGGAI